ncbi:MAG TPA: KipI antagonist, partial [Negativicutes bacterium]|nr:KipI antagonist [Negativicutes bacterium]
MLSIIAAGLFTTVQDAGRWGCQAYGMPVAGAMDRYAYNMANILAGNAPGAAALEMTVTGDTIRFEKPAYVAVCGADMRPTLDGAEITPWSAFPVPAGGIMTFGYAASGCRTYLAVRGGLDGRKLKAG